MPEELKEDWMWELAADLGDAMENPPLHPKEPAVRDCRWITFESQGMLSGSAFAFTDDFRAVLDQLFHQLDDDPSLARPIHKYLDYFCEGELGEDLMTERQDVPKDVVDFWETRMPKGSKGLEEAESEEMKRRLEARKDIHETLAEIRNGGWEIPFEGYPETTDYHLSQAVIRKWRETDRMRYLDPAYWYIDPDEQQERQNHIDGEPEEFVAIDDRHLARIRDTTQDVEEKHLDFLRDCLKTPENGEVLKKAIIATAALADGHGVVEEDFLTEVVQAVNHQVFAVRGYAAYCIGIYAENGMIHEESIDALKKRIDLEDDKTFHNVFEAGEDAVGEEMTVDDVCEETLVRIRYSAPDRIADRIESTLQTLNVDADMVQKRIEITHSGEGDVVAGDQRNTDVTTEVEDSVVNRSNLGNEGAEETYKFCPECGENLQELTRANHCPSCGNSLS